MKLFSKKLAAFEASEIMGQLNRRLLARSVPSVTLNLMSLSSQRRAALIHSLIKNHPFVDGNKRTGITAGVLFLWVNGYRLTATQESFEETAMSIAEGKMDLDEITKWLKANVTEV